MGWAFCGHDDQGREIGYTIEAKCDYPGCDADIDRGLGHVCGGMHGGDGFGCGKYFCDKHLVLVGKDDGIQLCPECYALSQEEGVSHENK